MDAECVNASATVKEGNPVVTASPPGTNSDTLESFAWRLSFSDWLAVIVWELVMRAWYGWA